MDRECVTLREYLVDIFLKIESFVYIFGAFIPSYIGRPTSAEGVRESLRVTHPGLLAVGVRSRFSLIFMKIS